MQQPQFTDQQRQPKEKQTIWEQQQNYIFLVNKLGMMTQWMNEKKNKQEKMALFLFYR